MNIRMTPALAGLLAVTLGTGVAVGESRIAGRAAPAALGERAAAHGGLDIGVDPAHGGPAAAGERGAGGREVGAATRTNDSSDSAAEQPRRPNGADILRVFLDCGPCDDDFLRREITFVNYVRDRRDAHVHVLVTRENTGGGGDAWTLDFYGLVEFEGLDDQIVFYTTQDDTDDSERRALAQMLSLGLVRYAAQTPLGQQLQVSARPAGPLGARRVENAQPEDDPWNFWVFRTRLNMFFDAEERESTRSISSSFSANRTTDMWKMRVGVFSNYREDTFQLTDSTFSNVSASSSLDARFVKSVGEHMGFGFGGSAISSTFRNQDLTVRLAPAVQYNFFPYSESTRRQFTVTYTAGHNSFRYKEPTIFSKIEEKRLNHALQTSFEVNEPWGESEVTMEFSQFLDQPDQRRLVLFGEIDIRLFRGFFLSFDADSSLIRDQIYLPRRGATDQEILVRQRQLATDYEWQFRIGFTYSFGSIFNNVVNSRFAGSSGGFTRAF